MDPLAHALAGTLLGRTRPSKERGWVLACVLGALAPDIDILLALGGREFYLMEHRGFTHSLLGILPVSLLAAGVTWLLFSRVKRRGTFFHLFLLSLLGVLSHLFLDWCTSWGTMLLWPDRTRFALDHLFIIDLWYSGLLAVSLVASVFLKKRRGIVCAAGLLLIAAYHLLAAHEHRLALGVMEKERPLASRVAFPQPFSPFRWAAFNRADGLLKNAQIDLLKSPEPLGWREWREPVLTEDIRAAMESPKGRTYLWFARVPMWEGETRPDGSTEVRVWDLRFHLPMRGEDAPKKFGARFLVKNGKVIEGGF